jgi:hypothetical protein
MAGSRTLAERALTREQIDPEFKGSAMDWVDKYGHVQLENAEQRATMRFSDWAIEFSYIARLLHRKQLPELDINWLRSPKPADVERMKAALDLLRPIVAQAEAFLGKALAPKPNGQAVENLNESPPDLWEGGVHK